MIVNDYDNFALFTPEGVVKPIAHLTKAAELGTLTLAISTQNTGIIIAYKQAQKIFKISPTTLYTFAGITNDGLDMVDYLVKMSVSEQVLKDRELDPNTCFENISYRAGLRVMMNASRPYGVAGLLMGLCNGVKLVEISPSGYVSECRAMSVGERAQSARTVLEREVKDEMEVEEMVKIGIMAIRNANSDVKQEDIEIFGLNSERGIFEINAEEYF
ncbi:Proteasome subunit alpha 1 [Conglomerata obtusa]